jgi:prefoldin subunit 5
MNKDRRTALTKLSARIAEIREELEALRDEEQEYFDNMPESLQGGDKGDVAQTAIGEMESAITSLESAEQEVDNAANG